MLTSPPTADRAAPALLFAGLLLLSACGGAPDDAPSDDAGPAAADTVIDPAAQALARAQRLDEGLPFAAAAVERVEIEEETHIVRLWRRQGDPVKLMASAPDETGRRAAHTEFYFENSRLFFVRDSDWRYVFVQDRLELVLDEMLEPVTVPADLLASHERRLHERLERYLEAYQQ